MAVGGAEKFVCPLGLANCEKDHLEPVSPPAPSRNRLVKKLAIAAVPALAIVLIWWYVKTHQPPPPTPAKTSVAIVVDGQVLNPVMVRTPAWLAEQQLRALCDNGGQNSYYAVQKSTVQGRSVEGEPELVTAYLDGLKTALGQILERFLEPPRNN